MCITGRQRNSSRVHRVHRGDERVPAALHLVDTLLPDAPRTRPRERVRDADGRDGLRTGHRRRLQAAEGPLAQQEVAH